LYNSLFSVRENKDRTEKCEEFMKQVLFWEYSW